MATFDQLPNENVKMAVESLAKRESFKTFTIKVSSGSKKGDNYLGQMYRILISGSKDNGENGSLSIILKMAPKNPSLRLLIPVNMYFAHEYYVYSEILKELDALQSTFMERERFHHPKLYLSSLEEGEEMIFLEDLMVSGFKMIDRFKSMDYDHLSLCIKKLAQFHATSFALRARNPSLYREFAAQSIPFERYKKAFGDFVVKNNPSIKKLIRGKPYSDLVCHELDTLLDQVERIHYENEAMDKYAILCHGDVWINNIMFRYEDDKVVDLQFIDWQLTRNTTPVLDISYLIFLSTDKQMREKHYEEILSLYYSTLASNITRMGLDVEVHYPERVFREQVKKYMKHGFLLSFSVLAITLSDVGESPEVEDMLTNDENNDEINFSESCKQRLFEVIEDCISYKII